MLKICEQIALTRKLIHTLVFLGDDGGCVGVMYKLLS
jgi:hypothetical protein